jgi:hypothetical protein
MYKNATTIMIIIDDYSKPIYIVFDYCEKIKNFKLDSDFFNPSGHVFILISWFKTTKIMKILNSNPNYEITILANSMQEKRHFEKITTRDVLFCNHNAFLNENVFNVIEHAEKRHELIIDSAFHEYKNVEKARLIKNTLHIGYFKNDINDVVIPTYGKFANFKNGNYKRLSKPQINLHYNESKVGGMFSLCEGACFASSQYLLSGLPVISTKSDGGREIWYNDLNSIICQNDEDSVYNAHQLALKKLELGEFNAQQIRNLHLQQMDEHRNTLIEYIKCHVLCNETIDIDAMKQMFAHF